MFLVCLLLRVLLRPIVSSVELVKQPMILTSYIVVHFFLKLLPASGEALKIGFLLLLIIVPASSERI